MSGYSRASPQRATISVRDSMVLFKTEAVRCVISADRALVIKTSADADFSDLIPPILNTLQEQARYMYQVGAVHAPGRKEQARYLYQVGVGPQGLGLRGLELRTGTVHAPGGKEQARYMYQVGRIRHGTCTRWGGSGTVHVPGRKDQARYMYQVGRIRHDACTR